VEEEEEDTVPVVPRNNNVPESQENANSNQDQPGQGNTGDEDTHDVPENNNGQVASTMTQENANNEQQGQRNTGEENEIESTEGSENDTNETDDSDDSSDDDTFQDILDVVSCDNVDIDYLKSIPKEEMEKHFLNMQ